MKKLCAVQIGLNKLATEAGKGTFGATLPDLVASLSRTPSVVYMPSTKEKLTFDAGDFKSKYEVKRTSLLVILFEFFLID